MKRICALAGLVLISVFPAHGAFQEKSFWAERAKKLAADRASLSSSGALDSTLASLIDGELARTNRMNSTTESSDTLRIQSGSSREAIAMSDAYATYLLREIVTDIPSSTEETRAMNTLSSDIAKRFEAKDITPDRKFMSTFMSRLSPLERSILAIECGTGARKRSFRSPGADRLPPENCSFSDIQKYYSDNPIKAPAAEELNSTDSSVAKALIREADEYANTLNDAREFLGSKGLIADASTLSQYAMKTSEMGRTAFTKLSNKLMDTTRFDRGGLKSGMEIPAEPDMHAIFADIDRIRDDSVSSGKSDPHMISDTDRGMRAAISRGVSASADILLGAEEKSSLIDGVKTKPGSAISSPDNNDAVSRARSVLRVKIQKAQEYREANLRFISLADRFRSVSEKNRIHSPYPDRIQSLRAISTFVTELDAHIRKSNSTDLNTIRQALIPRQKAFLERLSALSAIPDTERVCLGKEELKRALDLRTSFAKEIQTSIGSLRSTGNTLKPATAPRAISSRQDDENAISDSIRSWTSAINGARRMDSLLAEYSTFFGECEKDAKDGRMSGRLAKVFDDRSLMNSLSTSFAQKIRDEDIRHTFLAGWLKGDLARLNAVHASGAEGTTPVRSLSDDEMKAANEALTPHSPVRIAAWNLSPSNLVKTDANAVAYLSKLFARTSAQKGSVPMRNVTLSDAQYAFSIEIPKYYEDTAPSANMRMHAIMRGMYTDLPRASTIHFLIVPNNFKGTRSVLEEFVDSIDMKVIKWKESGADISKSCTVIGSGNGDVVEASAVERGGMIVVIAGTSPKNRYGTLSAALRTANYTLKSAIGE